MRKHLWFAIGCAAASQLACGFILDFDSLTGGAQPALADGGLDASAGCVCDDQDPCTVDSCADGGCKFTPMVCVASDSCHVSVCNAGQCEESAPGGFVDDGYEDTLEGARIFRTTTTAAGSRFYVATYGVFDDKRDIILSVFEAVSSADAGVSDTKELAKVTIAQHAEDPVASPAAVVVDSRFINVYFATKPDSVGRENAAGHLQRVRIGIGSLTVEGKAFPMSTTPNFRVNGDTVGPAAGLLPGGTPFVVWPGCATNGSPTAPECVVTSSPTHGIYVAKGGEPADLELDPTFFPEAGAVTGLTALGNGPALGAAWMVRTDLGETAVRTAFLTDEGKPGDSQVLFQCGTLRSTQHHALASSATTDGLRVLGWSELASQTTYAAQVRPLTCSAEACTEPAPDCDAPDNNLDGVSNLDFTLLQPQSKAEWFRSSAFVTANSASTSSLSLVLSQFSGVAAVTDAGVDAGVNLDAATDSDASAPLSGWTSQAKVLRAGVKSVDWPSIAANGDRVMVAWTEPGSGNTEVRHLVRQRVCFPE